MANTRITNHERHMTPDEVAHVDARRRRGQLLLTIGFQTLIITALLTLWVGQDLTYSPGWIHPMFYWACATGLTSIVCLFNGVRLRRGHYEFTSY